MGKGGRRRNRLEPAPAAHRPQAGTPATRVAVTPARPADVEVSLPRGVLVERLHELTAEQQRLTAEVETVVRQLVATGVSWAVIGSALGVTRQGARQRFGIRARSHAGDATTDVVGSVEPSVCRRG